MEATGPRKELEGCCDCGEHINFSNLSSNIKAPGFIFQRRLTISASPKAPSKKQMATAVVELKGFISKSI